MANWEPWNGVFETLRVEKGRPLFMAEHESQMRRAAHVLGLEWRGDFSPESATLPKQSGRWRWILTSTHKETLFNEEIIEPASPVKLVVSPVQVGSFNWDARFKTLSYLGHGQARQLAAPAQALQLNETGHVASSASGNIFWVSGGQVFTPAHEVGCREGIVRSLVIGMIPVKVGAWTIQALREADEIFLTGSLRGIIPVAEFENRHIEVGPVTQRLIAEYERLVQEQLKG